MRILIDGTDVTDRAKYALCETHNGLLYVSFNFLVDSLRGMTGELRIHPDIYHDIPQFAEHMIGTAIIRSTRLDKCHVGIASWREDYIHFMFPARQRWYCIEDAWPVEHGILGRCVIGIPYKTRTVDTSEYRMGNG